MQSSLSQSRTFLQEMKSNEKDLPIKHNLKLAYISSLIIASLFVITSALGYSSSDT